MDIVYIKDLRADTVIGIYEWERRDRQSVTLDIEVGTDVARAATGDRIEDTINYRAVSDRIREFAGTSEFRLVESLAEGVAAILLNEFSAPWCRVRVGKPGILRGVRDVGVIIERGTRS